MDTLLMLRLTKTLAALILVGTGLYLAVFGNAWGPLAFEWLPDTETGFWLELIVPFVPILFIGLGAALLVSSRR